MNELEYGRIAIKLLEKMLFFQSPLELKGEEKPSDRGWHYFRPKAVQEFKKARIKYLINTGNERVH